MREQAKIDGAGLLELGFNPRNGMIDVTPGVRLGLGRVEGTDMFSVRIYSGSSTYLWPNKFTLLGQVKSLISLLRD